MAEHKAMTASARATRRIIALDKIGNDPTRSRRARAAALFEADVRVEMLREFREDIDLDAPPAA